MRGPEASERQILRARYFRVDPRRIVHETIDGETIVIDLETGTYYSLTGSGPEIWALLLAGCSEEDIIGELCRRHTADDRAIDQVTSDLIKQLYDEGLLEAAGPESEPKHIPSEDPALSTPFESPVFERYTDMEYFLLLDPIHEVEEGGWPRAAAPASPQAGSG